MVVVLPVLAAIGLVNQLDGRRSRKMRNVVVRADVVYGRDVMNVHRETNQKDIVITTVVFVAAAVGKVLCGTGPVVLVAPRFRVLDLSVSTFARSPVRDREDKAENHG